MIRVQSQSRVKRNPVQHQATNEILHLVPGKLWLDDTKVVRKVTQAVRAGYKYPYLNWRETPHDVRDAWWNLFKGYCTWSPELSDEVRKWFNETARVRLKDNVHDAGKKVKGKHKPCPKWMTPDLYKSFLKKRKDKQFRKRSVQASANKKCAQEGPSHHFGSIKASKHASKMMAIKGKVPTAPELFFNGHSKNVDGKRELTHPKAKEIYEKYENRHRQLEEEGQPIDENQVFYDVVGGHRKGHVYGVGSAATLYYDASSKERTTLQASSYVPGILSQVEALQKEAEEHRKYREESTKIQEEMRQQLLNLQALIQTQNCNPNSNHFPNHDHDISDDGVGGAGVGLQV